VRAPKPKHDWKQEIKDLSKLSHIPKMKPWLLISFFFYFGWGFYVLFYPALLVTRFHYNQAMIGLLSGYSSIFWFASSLALNRGLATRFKPEAFILLGLPITGIFCVVLSHTDSILWWYVTFPISAIFGSAIWSMTLAVLSNLAGKENQGKVFGVAQSLTALAMFISPMLSGVLASISDAAPLTTSGIILALNGVFAALYYFRKPSLV
jgi:sugar phosphate permease